MSGMNGLVIGAPAYDPSIGVNNAPGAAGAQKAGQGNGVVDGPLPPAGGGNAAGAVEASFAAKIPPGVEERMAAAIAMLESGGGRSITQMIAHMMIRMAADKRWDALVSRTIAHEQQKVALEGQASEMREAASKLMQGAIMSLVLTVVASTMSTMIGALSLKQQTAAVKDMGMTTKDLTYINGQLGKLGEPGTDPIKIGHHAHLSTQKADLESKFRTFDSTAQNAQMKNQVISSVAHSVESASMAAAKILEARSKLDDAEGQLKAAEATWAAQQGDIAKEIQQNMKEMMATIISFLKDLLDAEVEQMRSITRA